MPKRVTLSVLLTAARRGELTKKHQLWAYPARLLQRLWHPKLPEFNPAYSSYYFSPFLQPLGS
jgi:hypothetical protein